MSSSNVELHQRLAQLRRGHKLTLRQLRENIENRTGETLSISFLSAVERDEVTPSIDSLKLIAQGYDMSVEQLLEPVTEFSEKSKRYPDGLQELVDNNEIEPEWADVLARIEFRGRRANSRRRWLHLYHTLQLVLEDEEGL